MFSDLQVNIYLMLLSTCFFSDIVHFLSLILTPTSLNLKRGHLLLSCLCVSLDFHLKKSHRKSNSIVLDIHATCNMQLLFKVSLLWKNTPKVLHIYKNDSLLHERSKYWRMNSITNRRQAPDCIHLRDSSSNLDSKGQRGKPFIRKDWKPHGSSLSCSDLSWWLSQETVKMWRLVNVWAQMRWHFISSSWKLTMSRRKFSKCRINLKLFSLPSVIYLYINKPFSPILYM